MNTNRPINRARRKRHSRSNGTSPRGNRSNNFTTRIHLRKFEPLDLPTRRARDRLDEENPAIQRLVAGQLCAREAVYFGCGDAVGGWLCAFRAHDEGSGGFFVVFAWLGDADYGGVFDVGVFD